MLKLKVPALEVFNEVENSFITKPGGVILTLEHSLVSVSKWESKWRVPFLSKSDKTIEQTLDYIRCMTLTQNIDDDLYYHLTENEFKIIDEYINNPMTATVVINRDTKCTRDIITAEIIYYWMISLNIPFECQKWHLNRLLMLINVCSIKQQPPKKLGRKSIASHNTALNAQRRALMNTRG